ncbi:MAG: N-acetyltransferase [Planctomycetota bacterium]|nr:N-acetyltransferase [Planctomycetota bacterium]
METDSVVIRRLRPDDLDVVVRIDEKNTGRRRAEYFEIKLEKALAEVGIEVSLAAGVDGAVVGFLLCWVHYGEFGQPEPVAVLDTIGVAPEHRGAGVGQALLDQLRTNLLGLGIRSLRTEVSWEDQELLLFFQRIGFQLTQRLCLDLELDYE